MFGQLQGSGGRRQLRATLEKFVTTTNTWIGFRSAFCYNCTIATQKLSSCNNFFKAVMCHGVHCCFVNHKLVIKVNYSLQHTRNTPKTLDTYVLDL